MKTWTEGQGTALGHWSCPPGSLRRTVWHGPGMFT